MKDQARLVIIGGAITGCSIAYHPTEVGGLLIASSKDRMKELRRSAAMAKTFGLPMELISPKEACDLFPVMNKKGIVGAAFLPTDGQIDPSGVTYALAKGARDRGATIHTETRVTGRNLKKGAIDEVRTEKGNIKAEIVVNAAGIWATEIAKLVGVPIPIIPREHQYIITKPPEGVR